MAEFSWLSELGIITILGIVICILAFVIYKKSRNGNNKKNTADPLQDGIDDAFNRIWDMEKHCAKTQKEFGQRLTAVESDLPHVVKDISEIKEDIKIIKQNLLSE